MSVLTPVTLVSGPTSVPPSTRASSLVVNRTGPASHARAFGSVAGVPRPSRVVVLYGGQSAEHDVSCVSARFVADALGAAGYEALPIGITRDGRWVEVSAPAASGRPDEPLPSPDVVDAAHLLGRADLASLSGGDVVAFPVLHGPMGEDGTVQGYCEVIGLPYVGAGVLASSLCMDKAAAKEVLSFHGLPQVRWQSSPQRTSTRRTATGSRATSATPSS